MFEKNQDNEIKYVRLEYGLCNNCDSKDPIANPRIIAKDLYGIELLFQILNVCLEIERKFEHNWSGLSLTLTQFSLIELD